MPLMDGGAGCATGGCVAGAEAGAAGGGATGWAPAHEETASRAQDAMSRERTAHTLDPGHRESLALSQRSAKPSERAGGRDY